MEEPRSRVAETRDEQLVAREDGEKHTQLNGSTGDSDLIRLDDVSRPATVEPSWSQDAIDASDEWLLRSWARGGPGPRTHADARLRSPAMISFASFAEFPSGAEHSSRRPRRRGDQV